MISCKSTIVNQLQSLLCMVSNDYIYFSIKIFRFQKPWKARDPWPVEAADSHYLAGMCHMELRNYLRALEAFTNAIKLNPNMAEVN